MAATNGSIFGAMLQEFDGAARILNLEPGIWKILTHPKRQITVSCPIQMDNGEIQGVTGKPIEMGGSLGRREATGRGVMIVTRESLKHLGASLKGATIAVQGFGNVGSISAELLAEQGAKIVAVTDWKGGVYNEGGLDIPKLLTYVQQRKTVDGFSGAEPLASADLFTLAVDVLIPAALENQITIENAPN